MGLLSRLKDLVSKKSSTPSYLIYETAAVEDPEKIREQYAKLENYISDYAYTHGWNEIKSDSTLMYKVWSYGYFNIRIGAGGRTWGSLYGFSLLVTDMRVWNKASDVERASGFFKDRHINFGGWTYTTVNDEELSKTKDKLEILQQSMMKEN